MAMQGLIPVYNVETIVKFFKEVGLEPSITVFDLKTPKPDRISNMYTSVIHELGFYTDVTQMQWSSEMKFENPETFEAAIPLINLISFLRHFFTKVCVENHVFNIKDIMEPQAKRTRIFMSALINFYRFVSENKHEYIQLQQEYYSVSDKIDYLKKLYDDKLAAVNTLKIQQGEQEPFIKKLEQKIQQNCTEVMANQQMVTDLKELSSNLKVEISEQASKKEQRLLELEKIQQQVETLKARKCAKQKEGELKRQLIELNSKREIVLQRLKDVNTCNEKKEAFAGQLKFTSHAVDEIAAVLKTKKEGIGELQSIRIKNELLREKITSNVQHEEDFSKELEIWQQKNRKMDIQLSSILSSRAEFIETSQKELHEINKNAKFTDEDIQKMQNNIDANKKDVIEIKENVAKKAAEDREKIDQLTEGLKHYRENMVNPCLDLFSDIRKLTDIEAN